MLVVALAYVSYVVGLAIRLRRHGIDGPPSGFDIYRAQSYTPEGQRLLRIYKRWLYLSPVAFLLIAYAGGTFCLLTGWSRHPH
jgi:hypothetical protein